MFLFGAGEHSDTLHGHVFLFGAGEHSDTLYGHVGLFGAGEHGDTLQDHQSGLGNMSDRMLPLKTQLREVYRGE